MVQCRTRFIISHLRVLKIPAVVIGIEQQQQDALMDASPEIAALLASVAQLN